MQRIILKHDKRGVDHLLVTVGGPSENGFGFTSEELIMKFLFEIPIVAISTKYIKRTIIHFWSSGSYFQLEEDGVTTQDNIFTAGYNVAHHTL